MRVIEPTTAHFRQVLTYRKCKNNLLHWELRPVAHGKKVPLQELIYRSGLNDDEHGSCYASVCDAGRGCAGACAACRRQDQKGLRIFLRDTEPLESIARRLSPPAGQSGSGDIALVLRLDMQTEIEFKLDGRFQVSPQIAGAIKAVAGVEMVETL